MDWNSHRAVSGYGETESVPTVITKWLNEYRTTFLSENHIAYQYSRKKHGRQISLVKRRAPAATPLTAILGYPPAAVIDT